jgi:mono/diheme cytochrome c family protein
VRGLPQKIPREEILSSATPRRRAWPAAVLLAWLSAWASTPATAPAETGTGIERLRERGAYVLRASGCVTCHTDEENEGQLLAGGRPLETPFGTFYSPNITFDREHGIGAWQTQDLFRALRHGVAPDGSRYYPVFPYTSYTRMRREDMFALWTYLATVAKSSRQNTPHDLVWYMDYRIANRIWQYLFFEPGVYQVDEKRSQSWNRGAYLVEAMAHCGECHTPRTAFGNLDTDYAYAGAIDGPEGESVPNITSDKATGIGDWSRSELVDYLSEGLLPDGDYAGSLMADVIDDGLEYLTPEDIDAIAEYITTLPAIENRISGEDGGG